jgi:hypothetical protein
MKTKVLQTNNDNPTKAYSGTEAYQTVTNILQCGNCTSYSFEVLQGSYLTVVKCLDCDYEYCVHEG